MPSLRSILSLLALGSVMVENPVPTRLIQKAVCLISLVVFSCIAVGALLLAAIVYVYQCLIAHGYTPVDAGMYMLGALAVIAIIAVLSSVSAGKKFVEEMKFGLKKSVPLTTHLSNEVSSIAEAFLRGLLNKNKAE